MEIENKSPFTTNSLSLIGFLFARGAQFVCTERKGRIVYFQFSADCKKLVQDFYAGGEVVAIHYWAGLQRAKDLIYSGGSNG